MVALAQNMPKQREPRERPVPVDPLIKVSDTERLAWKKRRVELKLNTREAALRIGTSNGTVSNIESGHQTQLRMSLYAEFSRVLSRHGAAEAKIVTDDALVRRRAALKRLARASAISDDAELEDIARLLERRAKRSEE